ncbi:hypothetical protein N9R83_00690 [Amylibacter sp.]|nr:hypothetical protein [Amylibacter sp.]
MFNLKTATAVAVALSITATSAFAEKVLRIQSVLSNTSDEAVMLGKFGDDVAALTGGSLKIEILPAGAIVGPRDIMDAVDAGLVEGGFAWTHYWGGKHVAANLFGAPVAGAGVGMDNLAFLSWFQYGGGKELYDRLWTEMGVNVKGFMLQPVGPEALGWFPEPITSMDDFRKMRFRAPPGMVAAAKKSLQAAADDNAFFAEVWQSQKDFADIAVPFWAGAQASNASLGKAHADTLK